MSIVVVYNPTSRVSRDQLERAFQKYFPGQTLHIVETAVEESTPALLTPFLDSASMVVAVGGDGTVSGAAAALLDTSIPLGIIPAGSTNMLARVNKVPLNVEAAIELLAGDHKLESIDAGVCGERVLLHLGGAGLDARIFERSSPGLKKRLKWLAYGPAALKSLQDKSSSVSVTVDGVTVNIRSRLILIANSGSLILPSFTVMPTESRSDGLFEVAVFTADSAFEIAQSLSDMTVMRWRDSSRVIRLVGREIRVQASPELPFEFDGDVIGTTPFALSVRQEAIVMICGY